MKRNTFLKSLFGIGLAIPFFGFKNKKESVEVIFEKPFPESKVTKAIFLNEKCIGTLFERSGAILQMKNKQGSISIANWGVDVVPFHQFESDEYQSNHEEIIRKFIQNNYTLFI